MSTSVVAAGSGTPTVISGDVTPPPEELAAATGLDRLDGRDRRRLRRAWWAGATPTLAVYVWIITVGRLDLFQRQYFDNFYDAQARSLFHGRLNVPRDVTGFEGFLIHGKTYIYFGPVPALLRMPILAVTDRFDGRLTTVSMLFAMVVLSVACFRLTCALRGLVRASPVHRAELWATGALAVAVLAGPPLFLASNATVYNEALAWGLALAVASFDAVLRYQREATTRRLVAATLLITATLLTRQSLGLGPLAALAVTGLVMAVGQRWAPEHSPSVHLRTLRTVGLACLLPLVVAVGVNYAKFETLLAPPASRQVYSLSDADRRDVLAENAGTLFGLRFVPTTLLQYLRPDGVDLRPDFPWIDFPLRGPRDLGHVEFDRLDWSSSLPASAPALVVLSVPGMWWALRRRGQRSGGPWIAPLWLGAIAGGVGVIAFGYVANRYLADLYPVILLTGLIGFYAAVGRARDSTARSRQLVAAALTWLVAFGALVNVVLALEYQRERGSVIPETTRAQWIGWRLSLPGASAPRRVPVSYASLPSSGHNGDLLVVGACDGLYEFFGGRWRALERGPSVGVFDLRIDVDRLTRQERTPVLTLGRFDPAVVAITRLPGGAARVDVRTAPSSGGTWQRGETARLDGAVSVRVETDFRDGLNIVTHGTTSLNLTPLPALTRGWSFWSLGTAPDGLGVAHRAPAGAIELTPHDMSVCRKALDLAGG